MRTTEKAGRCPQCGGMMPAGELAGLCPACLLAQGDETELAGAEPGKRFEPPPLEQLAPLFPQLEIQKLIGAGGMGAVYKARQPALDRVVALKLLPAHETGPINFTERFNREARALARLSHPNIVTVHEFGHAGHLHYFIMEYVDGANLRQLQKNARVTPREALQIIPQICDALQYAHDEGVVHRDIKPENVLVDRKGRVKIADFGLAKILGLEAESARLTVEGQVMGTPHYMAPEQVERPLSVDHRADIYSLGVVFYEMLTGDLPLGKFPPPSRKVEVDVRLDEVVLRALENDPGRRYQKAGDVKTELQNITSSSAPASSAPGAAAGSEVERPIRWAGIPVVVERNGNREISWNGACLAFGLGFLTLTAAFVIARLISGQPTYSFKIPAMFTAAVVVLGLRHALKAPQPALQHTDKGTVILGGKGRHGRWSPLAFAAILVFGVLWSTGLEERIRSGKFFQKRLAAQSAVAEPATGIWEVRLPGRGKIELLAVSYPDPAPNQWWRADGTPLTNELWQIENPGTSSYSNAFVVSTNRQLIFRHSDLPEGATGPLFEYSPEVGALSGSYVVKGDTHLEGGNGVLLAMPPQMKTTDVRVGFGLQPWRTIVTRQAQSQSSSSESRPGDPRWDVTFNNVSDTAEGSQVTVVMAAEDRAWSRRIVAVDTNGTEHSFAGGQGTPLGGSTTWTYTFRKLPLPQVREFRVQVQPVHWVEFAHIRMNPKLPLPPANRIQYEPAREITFNSFIDFDTGKVMEEPQEKVENFFEGMGAIVAWMERTGVDASAGRDELQPLGMIFTALENEDWDNCSPKDLTTKLHQGTFRTTELKPWKNGQLPSTFGFRTREGGTGILQLVAFDPDRPGVTLRYKLVKKASL